MKIFKKDDVITAALDGKELEAVVKLASPNGVSLMITFDGMLGGYIGMMPILYSEERKVFTDLIEGRMIDLNYVK